ncbi:hypothetical protein KO481_40290 [Nocardia sp. NEAU-G5]|uniref:Uncharacterized protein n=1 Tax=Nocardia albiluteola TaxID=2842303 RepID=A0ABS6BBS8_9NOCA|nr:hypothetical protein [Nocardia albiluteola]MBU3067746.1 hypothetical protein [Nocardia albiluteola]
MSTTDITIADIDRWNPDDIDAVFHICTQQAAHCDGRVSDLGSLSAFDSWGGPASIAAGQSVGNTQTDFDSHGQLVAGIAAAVKSAAAEVAAVKSRLAGLRSEAQQAGFAIAGDGAVVPTRDGPFTVAEQQARTLQLSILQLDVQQLLASAQAADTDLATAISWNTPIAIANRLANNRLHPINLSPDLIAYTEQQATADGIDPAVLLAILWQEQQWYQGDDGLFGAGEQDFGHIFDWMLTQTVDPTKSLGIAHMKLPTARMLADQYGITVGDTPLSSLNDAQLAKLMEEDKQVDIALAGKYLQYLRDEPTPGEPAHYGANTNAQQFLLYSADDRQVRDYNQKFGDDIEPRQGAIRPRLANYDQFSQWYSDTRAWEALTPAQRAQALGQLGTKQLPDVGPLLHTPYPEPNDINPVRGLPSSLPAPPPTIP